MPAAQPPAAEAAQPQPAVQPQQAQQAQRGRPGALPSKEEVARIVAGNLTDQFERLRGVPGYVFEPITWQQVVAWAAEGSEDSLGRLGRTPQHLVVYHRFKQQVLAEWASMADYMRHKVFGWPTEPAAVGRKAAPVPDGVRDAPPRTVWRENDFPYHLEPGIEHLNLWATRPLSASEVAQEVCRHRPGWETAWFVNPAALASIPGVWHAHVMSRQPPQS